MQAAGRLRLRRLWMRACLQEGGAAERDGAPRERKEKKEGQ